MGCSSGLCYALALGQVSGLLFFSLFFLSLKKKTTSRETSRDGGSAAPPREEDRADDSGVRHAGSAGFSEKLFQGPAGLRGEARACDAVSGFGEMLSPRLMVRWHPRVASGYWLPTGHGDCLRPSAAGRR